jgi:hypothetical protein
MTTPSPNPGPTPSTYGYGQSPDDSVDSLWRDAVARFLQTLSVAELREILPTGAGPENSVRHSPNTASTNPVSHVNAVSATINGKAQQLADLRARTDSNGYPIPDNGPANSGVTDTVNMLPNRTV